MFEMFLIGILLIIINMVILRWIFKVDEIVNNLKEQTKTIKHIFEYITKEERMAKLREIEEERKLFEKETKEE